MGLDMYAYVATKGQHNEHYDKGDWDETLKEFVSPVEKPREIAYWRKHPNLHGWMHRLWEAKGGVGEFNGDELELTWEDIDMLEHDIKNKHLPTTGGFFFGNPADDYYQEQDLEFVKNARAELFLGLQVFYNSSW